MTDRAKGKESVNIEREGEVKRKAKKVHGIKPEFKIKKYAEGDDPEEDEPEEVIEWEGNVFLNEGINEIWTALCGGSYTPFDATNAEIGVGDGTTGEDATQSGLQGSNTAFVGMDSGYPEFGSNQKVVFRATFGDTVANFSWKEITVRNDANDAGDLINLNRRQKDMGTKSSGTTWTAEITLSIA